MLAQRKASPGQIRTVLSPLDRNWAELEAMAQSKGERLAQADEQRALEEAIADANARLDELERRLGEVERGRDLRSVKELMKRKSQAEQDIQAS